MIEPAPNLTAAFARLERRLVRRRLAAIEPILRFEIAALGAILSASLFWQSRSRLGSIAFAHGPWAAAVASAQSLAGLALLGGALAAGRHALRLAPGSPAPPWLPPPIRASEVHRHLARTARPPPPCAAAPPLAPLARARVALALALVAAAGVASWIVALVASDPFPVVRGLPLGVGVVWGARLAWAAFGALALAAGQALGAGLSPAPSPPASF